jgi:hypothetical protein
MLPLMDPKKILAGYVLLTTVISVAVFMIVQRFFSLNWDITKIVTLSSTISSTLTFMLFSTPITRLVWRILCRWSKDIYPDLSGLWQGKIFPASESTKKVEEPLDVHARIKHSIIALYIDFEGNTFESITLSATPLIEKGQLRLHYVYRSESKIPGRESYNGTALLRVGTINTANGTTLLLSGQYHTDRRTVGTIELRKIGSDANQILDSSYI